jgi:hypothetical protein
MITQRKNIYFPAQKYHFSTQKHPKTPFFDSKTLKNTIFRLKNTQNPSKTPFFGSKPLKNTIFRLKNPHFPIKKPLFSYQKPPKKAVYRSTRKPVPDDAADCGSGEKPPFLQVSFGFFHRKMGVFDRKIDDFEPKNGVFDPRNGIFGCF